MALFDFLKKKPQTDKQPAQTTAQAPLQKTTREKQQNPVTISAKESFLGLDQIKKSDKRYIAIDFETSGLSSDRDRIIEVGAALFAENNCIATFSKLVNPGFEISKEITKLTGIKNKDLRNAASEDVVISELLDFIGDAVDGKTYLVAHNAKFDMGFMKAALERARYTDATLCFFDTLGMAQAWIPKRDKASNKLGDIASYFNVYQGGSHRAESDAKVCGEIFKMLKAMHYGDIEDIQARYEKIPELSDRQIAICEYISNILKSGGAAEPELVGFSGKPSGMKVHYLNTEVAVIKTLKKGMYILIGAPYSRKHKLDVSPASGAEGGEDMARFFFEDPEELEPVAEYICRMYNNRVKGFQNYTWKSAYYEDYKNIYKAYFSQMHL